MDRLWYNTEPISIPDPMTLDALSDEALRVDRIARIRG
jgi:hypothetical protein